MADPRHPAAYIRAAPGSGGDALARQHEAVAEAARQRGWPAPVVYAEGDDLGQAEGYGSALARLEAAIGAGRMTHCSLPGQARSAAASHA